MSYSSSSLISNQALQNHHQASLLSCLLARCNNDNGLSSASASTNTLQLLATNHHQQQQQQQQQRNHETVELLMSDFNRMSLYEQAEAMNDIRHAKSELQENPIMNNRMLAEFEREAERGRYPIYKKALKQDRSYVEDPAFRLYFLRAQMHDVKKAVEQMIAFLQQKEKHFGTEKLTRDITLADLTPADLELMLLSGMYHIQDGTDPNGRVIVYTPSTFFAEDLDSQIRVVYYIFFNILIPIHSVQMKGVVFIAYDGMKPQTNHGLVAMKRFVDFMKSLPFRPSACHFCFKSEGGNFDPIHNALLQFLFKAMPKHFREKACVHSGSPMEIQYKLSTYGIPSVTFPIDAGGNLRENVQNVWFYKYLEESGSIRHLLTLQLRYDDDDDSMMYITDDEESIVSLSSSSSADGEEAAEGGDDRDPITPPGTVVPTDGILQTDVLFGRGKFTQYFPGNIRFRQFLDGRREAYEAEGLKRRALIQYTRELIVTNRTRFLRRTGTGMWVVCGFDVVVDKVAQYYRTRRRSLSLREGR